MKSAEGAKILAGPDAFRAAGVKSAYEELSNLTERGIPLLVVTPEQAEQVAKSMKKIIKELFVP
jgi:hypothetical protein